MSYLEIRDSEGQVKNYMIFRHILLHYKEVLFKDKNFSLLLKEKKRNVMKMLLNFI